MARGVPAARPAAELFGGYPLLANEQVGRARGLGVLPNAIQPLAAHRGFCSKVRMCPKWQLQTKGLVGTLFETHGSDFLVVCSSR